VTSFVLRRLLAAIAVLSPGSAALAQDFPKRPITMIAHLG
jgi:tripartite-type tricarboxylate transporter receptor subunit TctC